MSADVSPQPHSLEAKLSDRELLEKIAQNQEEILKSIMFIIRLLTK